MSIIDQALKKAGKEKTAFVPAFEKKESSFNWGPLFVISVLLLITGPIVAPLFSTPFKRSIVASPSSLPSSTPSRKQQFAVEEAPVFQPAAGLPLAQPPRLVLSGIVYSSKDAYCILNSKIIKAGESIQEARLTSITPDRVVLDFRGQKITLYVS